LTTASVSHSKGQKLGRPKVRRERDRDAKVIRQMRAEGDSYGEIADELGRSKADIYRVATTLGCQPDRAGTASGINLD
jgi:DNA invertase Pin-like site-specific DNA recombinase